MGSQHASSIQTTGRRNKMRFDFRNDQGFVEILSQITPNTDDIPIIRRIIRTRGNRMINPLVAFTVELQPMSYGYDINISFAGRSNVTLELIMNEINNVTTIIKAQVTEVNKFTQMYHLAFG